jgi:hypothetical protein
MMPPPPDPRWIGLRVVASSQPTTIPSVSANESPFSCAMVARNLSLRALYLTTSHANAFDTDRLQY